MVLLAPVYIGKKELLGISIGPSVISKLVINHKGKKYIKTVRSEEVPYEQLLQLGTQFSPQTLPQTHLAVIKLQVNKVLVT